MALINQKSIVAVVALVIASSTLAAINQKQVKVLDKDKDGKGSRAEYVGFFAKSFEKKDKNKDGVLTPDEVTRASAFKSGDANKDGKLTDKEYASIFEKQFDRAHDKNKDGFASGAEITP